MHSRHQTLAILLAGTSLIGASSQHGRRILSRDYGNHCPYVEPGFPIELVVAKAKNVSTHSWEYGTAAEALLEFCTFLPSLCVQAGI